MHDEELASGGVGRHGARHGKHAAVMLEVVLEAVAGELTLDAVAGAADAGALGVAPWIMKPDMTRWNMMPS